MEEWIKAENRTETSLPAWTKVRVRYKDTSCSIVTLTTFVFEKNGKCYFNNGYNNPIYDVIEYQIIR